LDFDRRFGDECIVPAARRQVSAQAIENRGFFGGARQSVWLRLKSVKIKIKTRLKFKIKIKTRWKFDWIVYGYA
jgi:hypothetical protein